MTVLVVVPLLPGLVNKVAPEAVEVSGGMEHLFAFSWIYGFCTTCVLYYVLNAVWPDKATLISCVGRGMPELAGGEVEGGGGGDDVADGAEESKQTDVSQTKEVPVILPASSH